MRDRFGGVRQRTGLWIGALVVGAAAGVVALHVHTYAQLSPIDELQHIDYLEKASHGEVVARGDRVGEVAMRAEVCRGIDAAVSIPRCDAPVLRPAQFQEGGYNTAYVHPPTYYALSGVLARIGEALPVIDDMVTAGRLTGALWLGGAVALLWVAMGDLGAGRLARSSLLVILACSPTVLHATAIVTPDAMALLVGAALLLAILRWEDGRWPALVPAAVAAAAIMVKSTNIVAVGAAILYVAARRAMVVWAARSSGGAPAPDFVTGVEGDGAEPARSAAHADVVRVVAGLLAGVAAASIVWVVWQGAIAKAPADEIPMVQRFEVDSISVRDVRGQLAATVSPLRSSYLPEVLRTPAIRSGVKVVDVALIAGLVISAVYGAAGSRRRALASATLITMVAAGPLFVVINFVFIGTFVEIPARYALAVVPFALAAVTVALERRALLVGTAAYAAWLAFVTLVALAG
jgi:hypothetical protein